MDLTAGGAITVGHDLTVTDGGITLRDGSRTTFTDLFTGETLSFPCVLPAGKSFLFGRE